MNFETILYEIEDKILTITLNRPDRLNAFTGQMMDELISAFKQAGEDDDVRVVIVTGSGRGFCAGADLGAGEASFNRDENPRSPKTQDKENLEWIRDGGGRTTLAIFDCPKPVIAAINGPAVGVGVTMTLRTLARGILASSVSLVAFASPALAQTASSVSSPNAADSGKEAAIVVTPEDEA